MLIAKIDLEFIEDLLRIGVQFLVVGGYALRKYGLLREAGDLDLWVAHDKDNAERLLTVMSKSPYLGHQTITVSELALPHREMRLGGHLGHIQLLTSLGNIEFSEAYNGREEGAEGRLTNIPVISAKHLLIAKQFSLPLRETCEEKKKDEEDIKYLQGWLVQN